MAQKEDITPLVGGYASGGSSIKEIAVDTIFHTIEVAVRKLFHKTENSIRYGASLLHEAAAYFGEQVWYLARDTAYQYVVHHPEIFVSIPAALGMVSWARRNNPLRMELPMLAVAKKTVKKAPSPIKKYAKMLQVSGHDPQTVFNTELAMQKKIAEREKPFIERLKPVLSKAPYVLAASGLGALAMRWFRNRPHQPPAPPPPPPAPPIRPIHNTPYYIRRLQEQVQNVNRFYAPLNDYFAKKNN